MISKKSKSNITEKRVNDVLSKIESMDELTKLHERLHVNSIWSKKLYDTISFKEAKERTATMLYLEAENNPEFFSQLCDEYSIKSHR